MKEMKVFCSSREHADRVIKAAERLGYHVGDDYLHHPDWSTMVLRASGNASFWPDTQSDYPEHSLYGDHLLPVSAGWIENRGECPVAKGTKVDVLYRDGAANFSVEAGGRSRMAGWWGRYGGPGEIIAYRLAEPADDAPVEWGGTGKPPVGARVSVEYAPDWLVTGMVKMGPDRKGYYIILDDDGGFFIRRLSHILPIQSERDRAAAEISRILRKQFPTWWDCEAIADEIYDAGYRKTEANDG